MLVVVFVIGALALGLLIGRLHAQYQSRQRLEEGRLEVQALLQEKSWIEGQWSELKKSFELLQASEQHLKQQNAVLQSQLDGQMQFLQQAQAQLSEKFELLAHQALEKNRSAFSVSSQDSLSQILVPLRDKLMAFEKRLEEDRLAETRELGILQHEIKRLADLNSQMSLEAQQLTRALKGDVKLQGNWGEMVLEKILEASGLRDGNEYSRQSAGMGLRDDEGNVQRPDIIVHLPEQRHLILDSKVSLKAYERWSQCEMAEEKTKWASEHVESVIRHIRGLSEKEYCLNEQLISPDFVMMFIPIEAAFSAALQLKPDLFQVAWEKKVVIVSPTTLLATLRTVESIWRQEKQTRNALEIARVGGGLYDEFVRFLEELQVVGEKILDAQTAHQAAVKRLAMGRGNLINRVETLRELGARTKKQIPEPLQPEV
jgi:DNA recombination protein RmuC